MTDLLAIAEAWGADVAALVGSVETDWPLIDQVWNEVTGRRADIHLQRQAGKDSLSFLAEAFTIARDRRLLETFGTELIKARLVDDRFGILLAAALGRQPVRLQAMQNGVFIPIPAGPDAARYLRSCDYVCRIDIGGEHRGTGVLVAPTLVATAAHVVQPLVRQTAAGGYEAAPGSLRQLTVTFGVTGPSEDGEDPALGTPATPATRWLEWYSPPADADQNVANIADIDGIADPDGPWDLALIRIGEFVPAGRAAPLREPPGGVFQVKVLHHPNGGVSPGGLPLSSSIGTVSKQLGVPAVRALHDANTDDGSSGAPIFDRDWQVVALHQGGIDGWRAALPGVGPAGNRAVPIRRLIEAVEEVSRAAPPNYLRFLAARGGNPPTPVIGRWETQDRIRAAQAPTAGPADRLLVVRGAPGLGLHFTARLVDEIGRSAHDEVVLIDLANVLSDDGAAFASRIGGVLSEARLERQLQSRMTTGPRREAAQVAPYLAALPETLVQERPLWLVLEGFAGAAVDVPTSVKDAIFRLMQDLERSPFLRLVLIGWSDPVPEAFTDAIETLSPPTGREIVAQLQSSGQEPGRQEYGDELADLAHEVLLDFRSLGLPWYAAALRATAVFARRLGPMIDPAAQPEAIEAAP